MTKADGSTGLTKDAGYQIGVRRTIQASQPKVWDFIFSTRGLNIWLGETTGLELEVGHAFELADGAVGEVRVFKPGSHARLTWQPGDYPRPSLIQIRIIEKSAKTTIAFHQEHLPNYEARTRRREHFKNALDRIEQELAAR